MQTRNMHKLMLSLDSPRKWHLSSSIYCGLLKEAQIASISNDAGHVRASENYSPFFLRCANKRILQEAAAWKSAERKNRYREGTESQRPFPLDWSDKERRMQLCGVLRVKSPTCSCTG